MAMRGEWFRVPAALLAGLLVASAAGGASARIVQDKFEPGDKAPEFENAFFLDGTEARIASLAGKKVLLLNFWGLRCGACLEEMPYLDVIAKKYPEKVAVWGVDTDGANVEMIRETLKSVGVSVDYPLITDTEFFVTDLYTNFLVPLTIVIDRDGIVRYIHTGFEKGQEKEYEAAVRAAGGA